MLGPEGLSRADVRGWRRQLNWLSWSPFVHSAKNTMGGAAATFPPGAVAGFLVQSVEFSRGLLSMCCQMAVA